MRNGAAGGRWLAEPPGVVADLTLRWNLELGGAFTGGTAGYVVAATDSTGLACVLKVAMPLDMDGHDAFARSVRAHSSLAGGDAPSFSRTTHRRRRCCSNGSARTLPISI